jgi:serine/threonine protein phosphatase PrpC
LIDSDRETVKGILTSNEESTSLLSFLSLHEGTMSSQHAFQAITEAYLSLDEELAMLPSHSTTSSSVGGTTATSVLVFSDMILVANAGDSRAILCCAFPSPSQSMSPSTSSSSSLPLSSQAIVLSVDHSAGDLQEQEQVRQRGGFIDLPSSSNPSSRLARVNGKLAVTRSLGDNLFGEIISPKPDVLVFRREQHDKSETLTNRESLVAMDQNAINSEINLDPCLQYRNVIGMESSKNQWFVIIASDGLWEVMSNDEAVQMVCGYLLEDVMNDNIVNYQKVAKVVAQEALLRGSSDNVAVVIISLI